MDKQSWFDFQSLSIYLLVAGLVAGTGYMLLSPSNAPPTKKAQVAKVAESSPKKTVDGADLDWIPEDVKGLKKRGANKS